MDLLIEFIGELLGELVLENGVSAASDHRRPRWQRVLILALIALVSAAMFALIAWAGVLLVREGRSAAGVCMFALDLLLIALSSHQLRKILRTFPRK